MRRGLTILLSALLAGMATATPAHAEDVMTCPVGNLTTNYDPPLSTVTRHTDVESFGSVTTCSPNTFGITGGTLHITATGDLNCVTGGASMGTMVFVWNTGQISVLAYPTDIALSVRPLGEAVVVVTGDVLSGPFAGGTLVGHATMVTLDPTACLLGGVESVGGPISTTFTGP
ncbi:hypothetical protein [Allorhizocola rhizosphaerae]|uniref:hypothetical protein n=1 Tax=Allorhizocola rhizosphaerae TaxID=1872709 RepID=UPI000E3DFAFD|nr:hypothetical protein [Allorhizocola rhizosphaerae]